ncbi:MAG: RHS repeat protein [Fimbriimonadaceae bacterium]|nr:RHS repeat protein [Fimbriimonadaceae bacterium]
MLGSGPATSYDAVGNLSVRVAKNPFGDTQSTTSTYDEIGNPLVERAWTTVVRTFTYDALDRPVSMSGSLPWSSTMNWAYDAAGNMVTITEFGPHSFTFDLAGRIVKGYSYNGSVITHTYDDNGNLVNVDGYNEEGTGTVTMAYDKENRLVKDMRNGTVATYTYSGDGLKRSSIVDGAVTTLVWDGSEYLAETE